MSITPDILTLDQKIEYISSWLLECNLNIYRNIDNTITMTYDNYKYIIYITTNIGKTFIIEDIYCNCIVFNDINIIQAIHWKSDYYHYRKLLSILILIFPNLKIHKDYRNMLQYYNIDKEFNILSVKSVLSELIYTLSAPVSLYR